jgi:hypothetical protein
MEEVIDVIGFSMVCSTVIDMSLTLYYRFQVHSQG